MESDIYSLEWYLEMGKWELEFNALAHNIM